MMLYLWLQTAWPVLVALGVLFLLDRVDGYGWGFFVLVATALNWIAYWCCHQIALMPWARPITEDANSYLYGLAKEQAELAGLPVPEVYEIRLPLPNAHAFGRGPWHAVVGVSSPVPCLLDRRELRMVLAHEMAHISNRDALVGAVAISVVGVVLGASIVVGLYGWIGAIVFLLPVVSWLRESRADMTAVHVCSDSKALASAIQKLPHSSTISFLLLLPFQSHLPTKLRVWYLGRLAGRNT